MSRAHPNTLRGAGPVAEHPTLSSPRRTIGVVGCGQVGAPLRVTRAERNVGMDYRSNLTE